jgi:hypothetical protein
MVRIRLGNDAPQVLGQFVQTAALVVPQLKGHGTFPYTLSP